MLLTFVPVTAFAASAVAMTVTPSASSVDVGDSVTVTVAISGNAEKAVGMQASLTYDPTVLQYESFTPKNANFKTSDFNLYSAGNFVMLYEDPTVTGVDLASDIVEVTFTALAPSDSSSVALNIVEFYDNNDEDFSPDMTGASTSIAVTAAMLEAATPTFDTDLSAAAVSYTVGETPADLTVAASATDAGVITYQWYNSSDNLTYAPIGGATSANYTPSTLAAGTTYYHVVATNTLGGSTATATCSTATVTVNEAEEGTPFPINYTAASEGALSTTEYSVEGSFLDTVYLVSCVSGTETIYIYYPYDTPGYNTYVDNFASNYYILSSDVHEGDEYNNSLYSNGWYQINLSNFTTTTINSINYSPSEDGYDYYAIRLNNEDGGPVFYLIVEVMQTSSESAETPIFTTDLSTAAVSCTVDETPKDLTVAASATDAGVITYQWYASTDNLTYAPIDGATDASYTPSTSAEGTTYYYVIATNTLGREHRDRPLVAPRL